VLASQMRPDVLKDASDRQVAGKAHRGVTTTIVMPAPAPRAAELPAAHRRRSGRVRRCLVENSMILGAIANASAISDAAVADPR